MTQQGWTATGVIEAPLDRVSDVLLTVTEGPVGNGNAPLLRAVPGAGRLLGSATLRGGPRSFTLHYGPHPGGKVEVDPVGGYFRFEGGYKFAAEYRFTPHPKGTLLTYKAINVAPAEHQNRTAVRFQFWLGGKLKIGLRGGLRQMGKALGCHAYPSSWLVSPRAWARLLPDLTWSSGGIPTRASHPDGVLANVLRRESPWTSVTVLVWTCGGWFGCWLASARKPVWRLPKPPTGVAGTYIDVETEVEELLTFELAVVPGLLQTAE